MAVSSGTKRKRTFPPSEDLGPYLHHPIHRDYVGWPDGTIWFTKSGKILNGGDSNGHTRICIGGKGMSRHRFNFEIGEQRCIIDNMDIDHINGNKKDDSWSNLQKLSRDEHNAKPRADNPHMARKRPETRGQKLIATDTNTITGQISKFASHKEAAKKLGTSLTTVCTCLKECRNVSNYTLEVDSPTQWICHLRNGETFPRIGRLLMALKHKF
jgi:hypothetical protein